MRFFKDPLWLFLLAGALIFVAAEWFAEEDEEEKEKVNFV